MADLDRALYSLNDMASEKDLCPECPLTKDCRVYQESYGICPFEMIVQHEMEIIAMAKRLGGAFV